ncbi:uncharacterized protein LOC110409738 [Herrania umbratica]|uniref:Uncharacterized protein LOC110409738 n=1 Tax=Herrania umbratica TaxID=108875 RepID=A0A6J0ZKW8_9ROSI|nr:uncharacterized protein LOC110409738 [Herrania umbratica]
MESRILQSLASKSPPSANPVLAKPSSSATTHTLQVCLPHRRRVVRVLCTNSSTNNSSDNSSSSTSSSEAPLPPPVTPPDTVEIRFKRGSRRRRQLQEDGFGEGQRVKAKAKANAAAADPAPKKFEEMSIMEKAMELYVGEKGLLFWLNKFAYASIFIVIGAWILFRFVGPALNLYELDSPPLSPTSMFKVS